LSYYFGGRPAKLLRFAAVGSLACFAALLGARSFAAVAAVLGVAALFLSPMSTLADAAAVGEAARSGGSYARVRLWGSVGFVVSSWGFGLWLDHGGTSFDVIPAALGCLALTALATLPVRSSGGGRLAAPSLAEVRQLAADPAFLLFLGASALHWASLSPFHLFFAVHLGDLGVGPAWVGAGIGFGVIAEVAVMWWFPAIAGWFSRGRTAAGSPAGDGSFYGVLAASYLVGAARWALTAVVDGGPLLAGVQVLHGVVFGAFYVGSIAQLARMVPSHLLATGRALFGAVAFGAGGLVGNAVAGALYDVGGGSLAFGVAAVFELLAAPLLLLCARRARAVPAASPWPR
jgi:PPP family 3-phenylpropionic acid transporter